jgi:hypothetical protein
LKPFVANNSPATVRIRFRLSLADSFFDGVVDIRADSDTQGL